MRGLARELLTVVMQFSLPICIAASVLWVVSYVHPVSWTYSTKGRFTDLHSREGDLFVDNVSGWNADNARSAKVVQDHIDWERAYAAWLQGPQLRPAPEAPTAPFLPSRPLPVLFAVNYRVIAGMSGLTFVAALALRQNMRLRAQLAGRCRKGSCDLTGNVSGVCPECGAIIIREEAVA